MPEPAEYRLITPKDSQALEDLIAATADAGGIGFTDEYQADLLAVHRGLAEEFHGVVAEQEDKIVGMVFGEVRWVQYAGQEVPGVYVSHLRVHPDYRRQGIARELSDWALEYITGLLLSDTVLYGAIMAGNVSLKLADQLGFRATKPIQGGVVPMRKHPPAAIPDLEVRLAERSELPAIVGGMNAFYREHDLWSPVSVDTLEEFLDREVAGVKPNQLYVAVRGGQAVAGLSLSDRTKLVRMRLARAPWVVRRLGAWLGILPSSGILDALTVRQFWFHEGELEAARYLWGSLRYNLRKQGNCLGVAYDPRDRLADVFQIPFWLPMFKARYLVRAPTLLESERLIYCIAGP
ncbi:MAG: GNAT family N-acetyltransferase [Anaerolineales bacterium]|nr:GNAT family N-acetyltransferase [Anaerolineales bacterium]